MNFSDKLSNTVEEVIFKYIDCVSSRFNINNDELRNLWNNTNSKNIEIPEINIPKSPIKSSQQNINHSELLKCSKAELVELCKIRGIKHTARNKNILVDRLTGKVEDKPEKKQIKQTIIQKLKLQNRPIEIRRNKHGNYEHLTTNLVFDKVSQYVIGKQNENGNIDELSKDDIETCNKFKFKFNLPENLNVQDLDTEEEKSDNDTSDDTDESEEIIVEEELDDDEEEDDDIEIEYDDDED